MTKRSGVCGLFLVLVSCGQSADPQPTSTAQQGSTLLPCEIGATLQAKCWECHGPVLNYGAPMHLIWWEDAQGSTKDGKEKIFQRMRGRIHSSAAPMPPRGFAPLTASEMALLDSWVDQGAPAGNGCSGVPGGGGNTGAGSTPGNGGIASYAGTTGAGGTVGTGGTYTGPPPTPDAGIPVFPPGDEPVEPQASECEYLHIHARDNASAAKFTVPSAENYYMFPFHVDVEPGAQALAFYPEIDNTQVIHHWLLYKTITAQNNNNPPYTALGTHPDAALMAGWAPGAGAWFLPSHVGMELQANTQGTSADFILEVHYNNSGPPTQDGSGVKVCKAVTHRPDIASLSWLGTEFFSIPAGAQNWDTMTPCHPRDTTNPIHILTTWPHMHKLGRHMTAIIHRNDGSLEDLVNVDFDFNYQWQYSTPKILSPGEWIENHCYHTNDTGSSVGFGEFTSQEMCFDFVAAYPAGSLVNGFSVATTTPCSQ